MVYSKKEPRNTDYRLILREKVQLFYQQLCGDSFSSTFQASTGWQWRFCK